MRKQTVVCEGRKFYIWQEGKEWVSEEEKTRPEYQFKGECKRDSRDALIDAIFRYVMADRIAAEKGVGFITAFWEALGLKLE